MAQRSKPFKSKFLPYVDQIKAWRRAGKTWKEVANELTNLGIKADAGNVCRVIGRIKRRPYPLGAEPEPETSPRAADRASEVHAKKEKQPDPLSTEVPQADEQLFPKWKNR
jgi:hypothetical protein